MHIWFDNPSGGNLVEQNYFNGIRGGMGIEIGANNNNGPNNSPGSFTVQDNY